MTSRRLLIIEDDETFARTLARSFTRRGYDVRSCTRLDALANMLTGFAPTHAVVDLRLGPDSGLRAVETLGAHDPAMRIVVLTGFASIATAVEAVKLGATHYLTKPANTDEIEAAFGRDEGDAGVAVSARAPSIKALEWEHIHRILAETNHNISETARRLGMHRRTLARKLDKRRPG